MIRILIVDDEPLPRERIRTLLAEHGDLEIVGECRDGVEALHAIQQEQPDLIFLDIQMPELDGFGVLRALPTDAMPAFIFVTAYDEYAIDAFEVNALDYLLKPIHPARFEKALFRAIEQLDQARKHEADKNSIALLSSYAWNMAIPGALPFVRDRSSILSALMTSTGSTPPRTTCNSM